MKAPRRSGPCALLVSLLMLAFGGCTAQLLSPVEAEGYKRLEQSDLPYHPLVYHLDLSILAYHLYAQTLVWPFDPYYEELDNRSGDRTRFIKKVHTWAKAKGTQQVKAATGIRSYRGPGILGGFDNNVSHDPIIYQYSRLHPWTPTVTQTNGRLTEYLTPGQITRQIRDVYMCYRQTGRSDGAVAMELVRSNRYAGDPEARDVLLAFEGGTGDKGVAGQPASQSLMGFVLLRFWAGSSDYDVHIAFRGSRSGSAERAIRQSLSDGHAHGNPDWITDLGYNLVRADAGGGHITTIGAVSRGFAYSMKSILPQLFRCLSKVSDLAQSRRPNRIYVSGHSLGGALAQHFVSAILLGNKYGPSGVGKAMPTGLRGWPWGQIKLITFSAPRAGNAQWAEVLTTRGLSSEFFSTAIDPIDRKALAVNNTSIVRRLSDPNQPAGYRVLVSSDPITTEKVAGGKHVGKTVYVNEPAILASLQAPDGEAHEPRNVRKYMLAKLANPHIPPIAWRYSASKDVRPEAHAAKKANVEKYVQLAAELETYYRSKNVRFDHASYARNLELFKTLLQAN